MKVLLCPDKFKGSLSAQAVCEAIESGLKKRGLQLEVLFHPMADGGDGSLEVLSRHFDFQTHDLQVDDPLGRPIPVQYFSAGETAFIELAAASGIVLLTKEERTPLHTSTFGTGQMIRDALQKGFQRIYLFLGGSVTNDAGIGILSALGFYFLDKDGEPLKPNGYHLNRVQTIRKEELIDFKTKEIILLCDVNNPLFGPNGAAEVYSRQKGATEEQVRYLDQGLRQMNQVFYHYSGKDVSQLPGSGAAGGIGAGLVALLGAKMQSGFKTLAELTGLESSIQHADWVISGEGKLDNQSLQGKVISGMINLCRKYQKPLTLLVGQNDWSVKEQKDTGIKQVLSIAEKAKSLDNAIANGAVYLEEMATEIKLT